MRLLGFLLFISSIVWPILCSNEGNNRNLRVNPNIVEYVVSSAKTKASSKKKKSKSKKKNKSKKSKNKEKLNKKGKLVKRKRVKKVKRKRKRKKLKPPTKPLTKAPSLVISPVVSSALPSVIFSRAPSSAEPSHFTKTPTMILTPALTLSEEATFEQQYAGFDDMSILSDTEIEAYQTNMAKQASTNGLILNAQVTLTSQEIIAMSNRRRLQTQSWTKVLKVIYTLTAKHNDKDLLAAFFQEHILHMEGRKVEIIGFMRESNIGVQELIDTVRVISIPSSSPSHQFSNKPSFLLSRLPSFLSKSTSLSNRPSSSVPSTSPNARPSSLPSFNTSTFPSIRSSNRPSNVPSTLPSGSPSRSDVPSISPSDNPSGLPSTSPSDKPSLLPSQVPSTFPSDLPSEKPSDYPSLSPSGSPSRKSSEASSNIPSNNPSSSPSNGPSKTPSDYPSMSPSDSPSYLPSRVPSISPSALPSKRPTDAPSLQPSGNPSNKPSNSPVNIPSNNLPISPSYRPSKSPSSVPSTSPSDSPSILPSHTPSIFPSALPSSNPSNAPSASMLPSDFPSISPSIAPSSPPSDIPSSLPSNSPSLSPTKNPSTPPSDMPSSKPTAIPSNLPSTNPSNKPSYVPSIIPTDSILPSGSLYPSISPSNNPSTSPSLSASPSISIPPSNSNQPSSSLLPSLALSTCKFPFLFEFRTNDYVSEDTFWWISTNDGWKHNDYMYYVNGFNQTHFNYTYEGCLHSGKYEVACLGTSDAYCMFRINNKTYESKEYIEVQLWLGAIPSARPSSTPSYTPSSSLFPSTSPSISSAPTSLFPSTSPSISSAPTICNYPISIEITTDSNPHETKSNFDIVTPYKSVLYTRTSYSRKYYTYKYIDCVNAGQYFFHLQDDGCNGGASYKIRINNKVIKESSVSGCVTSYYFELDQATKAPSSLDSINPSHSFYPSLVPSISILPSKSASPSMSYSPSICGASIVSLDVETDLYPFQTSWEIINDRNIVVLNIDKYALQNHLYTFEGCLNPGSYMFIIYDSKGNGMKGGYRLSIDNKIIMEGGGDDGFKDREVVTFDIYLASQSPTISIIPSQSPTISSIPSYSVPPSYSVQPSISPSLSPSSCSAALVTINVTTDDEAGETTWILYRRSIIDGSGTGTLRPIAHKNYKISDNHSDFVHEECINPGSYSFQIHKYTGNGMKGEARFRLYINNIARFGGGGYEGYKWEFRAFEFEI